MRNYLNTTVPLLGFILRKEEAILMRRDGITVNTVQVKQGNTIKI